MPYIEASRRVNLFYQDWGIGPVILFVHGLLFSHRVWDYQTNDLSNHFRTIAYDLRGFGYSDKPLSLYTYSEHATDLHNLILSLDLHNVTLVGWSLGSGICVEYLRLFGAYNRVSTFVSVDGTIPKQLSDESWPYGQPQEFFESAFRGLNNMRPEWQWDFTKSTFASKTIGIKTKEWLWSISMQSALPAAIKSLLAICNGDFRSFIPCIRIPIFLFQGAKDQLCSPDAAIWITKHNPMTKLVMFDESGHDPFLEEIYKFNRELERLILGI